MNAKGLVYLIGAGPGDPDLMTVRAVKALRAADVVVYDHLADPRIINLYVDDDKEKIYVGKQSSRHTMKQPDINKLLVRLALEGKVVARLKGGDPLVFGRGGEEALELRAAGINFEFIPGVTSAIGVPEYAGIPVTHRRLATSFAVITGHEDPTKGTSSVNWSCLATAVSTLVFLMGVENIAHICEELMKYGRSGDTPAAVIRWGTHPEQRTLTTTVARAAKDVAAAGLLPPAIFIVGEVVRLRDELNWFEKRPLFGRRIVVTRTRDQASSLSQQLAQLGADVVEIPTIRIEDAPDYAPLDHAIACLRDYKWIVFTSVNGVDKFAARLLAAGRDCRYLSDVKIAAIGPATAAALAELGIVTDLVPESYKAEDLAAALLPELFAGDRVLLPRAMEAREILPEMLRVKGVVVNVTPAYRTVLETSGQQELIKCLSAAGDGKADIVTFASSSTVRNTLKLLGDKRELLKNARLAAIGPITAKTIADAGFTADIVSEKYTIPGLVESIAAYCGK